MLLCAGEALIDMLPRQTEAGEAAFAPYPGGAVFNTAIASARLGLPTTFFTGLSTDLFGARLEAVLTANGISPDLAARSDRPTTLAFVTLTDGQASYAFYDENTAGRMLSPADLPPLPDAVSAVFVGGISLAVEPCAEAYVTLARRAHGAGRLVMCDPNIRPGFIADEMRYRERIDRLLASCDIVKVSDEDLHWLSGSTDLSTGAAALRAKGPRIVLVTEGAEGVTAYHDTGEVRVPARKVEVVDTVGAGDTFNGGFLTGLHEAGALSKTGIASLGDETLAAALTLGAQAAAVTVSRAGANPPKRDELP
jgi:fructokinase